MPLPIGTYLPSLTGATDWLNGGSNMIAAPDGPLLVQFWAASCPLCKSNMPRVLSLLDTYRAYGLRLLSIHMPRMESDMEADRVLAVSEELGLTGPSALDNAHTLGTLFQTGEVWPCYFFFDAEGKLRSRAAGQLGLKMAENSLARLLDKGQGNAAMASEPIAQY